MGGQTQLKGILILLLTAVIWGSSFVSQSVGLNSVDAFTFMAIRTLLGAFFLLPFVAIRSGSARKSFTKEQFSQQKIINKKTIKYGIIIGLFLCAATNFQQFAFYYSSSGKIAFITASYMFMVPIVSIIFLKKRISLITWFCVVTGFVGLYFLSFKTGNIEALNKGDLLTFFCSIFFCVQILLIERFSPKCDGIKLSCIEFFTAGTISAILMFIFEKPEWANIKTAAPALLYSGILSCGIAYTLQIIGQKYCEATIASLIMCMESIIAVLSGAIILHERLTIREINGCIIMFSAILISQISDIIKIRKIKGTDKRPSF